MSDNFLINIQTNSIEIALEMLRNNKNFANSKTKEKVTALMLSTVVQPKMKAIELIDMLVNSGATLNTRDNNRRNIILYACEHGVDPDILDRILYWNSKRKNILDRWWHHCDINRKGLLILAVSSRNINLVQHIIEITPDRNNSFLTSPSNHLLKALRMLIYGSDEEMALYLLSLSIARDIPLDGDDDVDDDYSDYNDYDSSIDHNIYFTDILTQVFNQEMSSFISTCVNYDIYRSEVLETSWLWVYNNLNTSRNIPSLYYQLANKHVKEILWKNIDI